MGQIGQAFGLKVDRYGEVQEVEADQVDQAVDMISIKTVPELQKQATKNFMAEIKSSNLNRDLQNEIQQGRNSRSGMTTQKFAKNLINMVQSANRRTQLSSIDVELMLKSFEMNNGQVDFN